MMRRIPVLIAIAILAGCPRQIYSPSSSFQFASDAAAIKATLDTTAAGWNRGELAVRFTTHLGQDPERLADGSRSLVMTGITL